LLSCDSMQIYKTMDIGTAKPSREDMARVRHHMVDIADPFTPYSCADYARDAVACAEDILSRGKLPVVCGGTGLYLEALLFERPFESNPGRSPLRDELNGFAEKYGAHALWERLNDVDPESAAAIHENNVRRVVRALEILETTGIPKSESDRLAGRARYDSLVIYLKTNDRKKREERIRRRTRAMFEGGLLDETARLYEAGVFEKNTTAAAAIGYKETLGAVTGETSSEEAFERLVIATRQYAKRQDTWFDRKSYATPVAADGDEPPYDECLKLVSLFLDGDYATGNE